MKRKCGEEMTINARKKEGNVIGGSHGEPKRRRQGHAHPGLHGAETEEFQRENPETLQGVDLTPME